MTASPSTARPPVTEDSAPASPPVLPSALSAVDPETVSSGLRIDTPALATRGFGTDAFREAADVIALPLKDDLTGERAGALRGRVTELTAVFPLHADLDGLAG
ncbi:hypothetical protein [Streptomyces flaveolus]|jgi:hypothetical protein|uniref:hypothetical protein n=1 Tax=Streptomyces flaveolus TaxID=67297 RepID=UPI00199AB7FC|nr:hypothetical protein [Streptomyces flaveolus]GGQ56186.1 hypothetical protein GCM10010216_16920 [Streptomyces flaveolus]